MDAQRCGFENCHLISFADHPPVLVSKLGDPKFFIQVGKQLVQLSPKHQQLSTQKRNATQKHAEASKPEQSRMPIGVLCARTALNTFGQSSLAFSL